MTTSFGNYGSSGEEEERRSENHAGGEGDVPWKLGFRLVLVRFFHYSILLDSSVDLFYSILTMMGLAKEVLRRICVECGWSYGVFWKLIAHGDQIAHLVWEDGHYERTSQIDSFSEDQVETLLFKLMVNQVHIVGDGLVGKVALTGNHEWLMDNRSSCKGFTEVDNQLLAGVKTEAFIPVLPLGVVQLGTTQMVVENFGFVHHVKGLFEQLMPESVLTNSNQNNLQHEMRLHESANTEASVKHFGEVDANITNSLASLTYTNSFSQMLFNSDAKLIKNTTIPHRLNSGVHYPLSTGLPYNKVTLLEEQLLSMSGISNNCAAALDNSSAHTLKLQSYCPTLLNSSHDSAVIPSISINQILNNANDSGKFSSFPYGSLHSSSANDLFEALNLEQYKSEFLDDTKLHCHASNAYEPIKDVSACTNDLNAGPLYNVLNDGNFCNGIFREANKDQLLDAVVSQFNSTAKYEVDDNNSCKTSPTTSAPKIVNATPCGLPPVHIKPEPAASGSVKSSCSTEGSGGYTSQINLWIEGQKMNQDNHSLAPGKKVNEVVKVTKKRSKPGENPRPRPKDRQMIQDRVKELRELIPNGAKCSIDTLLEKTIKHMLFLQSVTKHADKLKETGEPKIISNEGGLLLKDNFEGGATWAFEVGNQPMICPIVVEDLNPPRQLLVEMLCEERGLFLEIADLVRGLGLTILKGVIEARNDKIWARFAVEANRDVTRMEIFLSLVRLLEPGNSKSIEVVDNINEPNNMFPSPSYIPATGSSDRIW